MKPKLLVLELWGVGDLAIASQFLQAAREKYAVSLLAKPHALELQKLLWPEVRVIPFVAPWTVFRGKYRIWNWPWKRLSDLARQLQHEEFQAAASARWDPRDHWLMARSGARQRIGFPRTGSRWLLTQPLQDLQEASHRYAYWRALGEALEVSVPEFWELPDSGPYEANRVVVHSGAAQRVRVWQLAKFQELAERLRGRGMEVQILCDPNQLAWWRLHGESEATAPPSLTALAQAFEGARLLIANDSGPGHLAAALNVPTFTIFGPQRPEWFHPVHVEARWIEGKPCPHKPCFDACRFPEPTCLYDIRPDEVWEALQAALEPRQRSRMTES